MMRTLAALFIGFALCGPLVCAPARAADTIVKLTLDGRPVDRSSGSAILHGGIVYGNLVDLVRSFDGVLTFQHDVTVVSVNGATATFTVDSATAKLGVATVPMRGPVFIHDGDVFVPLEFFITRVVNAKVRISPDQSRADIYVNSNPLS